MPAFNLIRLFFINLPNSGCLCRMNYFSKTFYQRCIFIKPYFHGQLSSIPSATHFSSASFAPLLRHNKLNLNSTFRDSTDFKAIFFQSRYNLFGYLSTYVRYYFSSYPSPSVPPRSSSLRLSTCRARNTSGTLCRGVSFLPL